MKFISPCHLYDIQMEFYFSKNKYALEIINYVLRKLVYHNAIIYIYGSDINYGVNTDLINKISDIKLSVIKQNIFTYNNR